MDRQFDLVVSLEVAEHLPAKCAETYVDSLTRLDWRFSSRPRFPSKGGPTT